MKSEVAAGVVIRAREGFSEISVVDVGILLVLSSREGKDVNMDTMCMDGLLQQRLEVSWQAKSRGFSITCDLTSALLSSLLGY